MSATLVQELPHSPGVWAAAWKRLKNDRVGMVALGITLLFILMVVLAQVGVIAKDWQKEVGAAFAPPHFVGKIVDGSTTAVVEGTAGTNVDLSDVDPLAPRYKEWLEAAANIKTATVVKADTLIFGGDQLGRDGTDSCSSLIAGDSSWHSGNGR